MTLNGCSLWENHALGLALGPLWGMALASLYGNGKASKGNPDSEKESETKKTANLILRFAVLDFGAGYGNRTRLCGLGSDHSTDELTLHIVPLLVMAIIAEQEENFNPFFVDQISDLL